MSKWVQHKSGHGDKFSVGDELPATWIATNDNSHTFHLPKSEYVECPPPEEWEDVTDECVAAVNRFFYTWQFYHNGVSVSAPAYRVSMHCGHFAGRLKEAAFIIERRKS